MTRKTTAAQQINTLDAKIMTRKAASALTAGIDSAAAAAWACKTAVNPAALLADLAAGCRFGKGKTMTVEAALEAAFAAGRAAAQAEVVTPNRARLIEIVGEDEAGFMQTASTAAVLALATGIVSGSGLAREEIAQRGLNHLGEWIGFEAAACMWLGKDVK